MQQLKIVIPHKPTANRPDGIRQPRWPNFVYKKRIGKLNGILCDNKSTKQSIDLKDIQFDRPVPFRRDSKTIDTKTKNWKPIDWILFFTALAQPT